MNVAQLAFWVAMFVFTLATFVATAFVPHEQHRPLIGIGLLMAVYAAVIVMVASGEWFA